MREFHPTQQHQGTAIETTIANELIQHTWIENFVSKLSDHPHKEMLVLVCLLKMLEGTPNHDKLKGKLLELMKLPTTLLRERRGEILCASVLAEMASVHNLPPDAFLQEVLSGDTVKVTLGMKVFTIFWEFLSVNLRDGLTQRIDLIRNENEINQTTLENLSVLALGSDVSRVLETIRMTLFKDLPSQFSITATFKLGLLREVSRPCSLCRHFVDDTAECDDDDDDDDDDAGANSAKIKHHSFCEEMWTRILAIIRTIKENPRNFDPLVFEKARELVELVGKTEGNRSIILDKILRDEYSVLLEHLISQQVEATVNEFVSGVVHRSNEQQKQTLMRIFTLFFLVMEKDDSVKNFLRQIQNPEKSHSSDECPLGPNALFGLIKQCFPGTLFESLRLFLQHVSTITKKTLKDLCNEKKKKSTKNPFGAFITSLENFASNEGNLLKLLEKNDIDPAEMTKSTQHDIKRVLNEMGSARGTLEYVLRLQKTDMKTAEKVEGGNSLRLRAQQNALAVRVEDKKSRAEGHNANIATAREKLEELYIELRKLLSKFGVMEKPHEITSFFLTSVTTLIDEINAPYVEMVNSAENPENFQIELLRLFLMTVLQNYKHFSGKIFVTVWLDFLTDFKASCARVCVRRRLHPISDEILKKLMKDTMALLLGLALKEISHTVNTMVHMREIVLMYLSNPLNDDSKDRRMFAIKGRASLMERLVREQSSLLQDLLNLLPQRTFGTSLDEKLDFLCGKIVESVPTVSLPDDLFTIQESNSDAESELEEMGRSDSTEVSVIQADANFDVQTFIRGVSGELFNRGKSQQGLISLKKLGNFTKPIEDSDWSGFQVFPEQERQAPPETTSSEPASETTPSELTSSETAAPETTPVPETSETEEPDVVADEEEEDDSDYDDDSEFSDDSEFTESECDENDEDDLGEPASRKRCARRRFLAPLDASHRLKMIAEELRKKKVIDQTTRIIRLIIETINRLLSLSGPRELRSDAMTTDLKTFLESHLDSNDWVELLITQMIRHCHSEAMTDPQEIATFITGTIDRSLSEKPMWRLRTTVAAPSSESIDKN
ncbi:hypothetical protein EBU99_13340 [bacterium]|nr:hypothetical protein [bacterium]